MMNNRAGWLALSVLAIATLLMVFFVLPRISNEAKPVGEAINAAGTAIKEAVTEGGVAQKELVEPPQVAERNPQSGEPAGKPDAGALSAGASGQQAALPVTPAFDVLRVEPDGSTVIAGSAAPGSKLQITNGTTVIAEIEVGPSGDFAAVLDKPLPTGDHQLVLKAIGPDGKVATSEEIATVSIPKDGSGKLLAMVTKPGKASRLMTVPTGQDSEQTLTAEPASGTGATPTAEMAAANGSNVPLPGMPGASSSIASSAPNVPAAGSSASPATNAPELQVTAVEIEGSKIFVAGVSQPNASLRGQANGKPIGAAVADADGHFVIEGNAELAIGDHTIGVETVGPDGKARLRVEVPFNRPSGDQIAAVAGPRSAEALSPVDGGAFDKLRNEVARAFGILRGLYDGGKEPTAEQLAAARSATGIALKSLSEYRAAADASASVKAIAENTARDAAAALASLDALPKDVKSVAAGLSGIGDMIARAIGPVIAKDIEGAESAATAPVGEAGAQASADTATITQAPLTPSEQKSVIIRRGDTLWQISRRVYGQGVRYTTIYLANQDKIANPDIIQPGQTFGVPDEALPDAEEQHRKRMKARG